MPNTRRWRGNARVRAQVETVTIYHVEAGVVYTLTYGGKSVSYTATAQDTTTTVMTALAAAWNAAIEPQFSEITADDSGSSLTLTADVAGVPFDLTATQTGTGGNSEVKTITITNSPTGGTWSWVDATYGTVSGLAYNISAASLQTALETPYGAGNVTVAGSAGGPFTVTFGGTLAHVNIPDTTFVNTTLTGGNATVAVTTTTQGSPGTSEVQTITFYGSPTGGTFTVTFNGFTTPNLAYNISAADLQTALRALTSIGAGNINVAGAGPYVCTFAGSLASTAVSMMTVDATLLTGGTIFGTIATTVPGVAGTNEQQLIVRNTTTGLNEVMSISKSGTVSGGTFRWSHGTGGGISYSATVAYNAPLWQALDALEDLLASELGTAYCGPYFAPLHGENPSYSGNKTLTTAPAYWVFQLVGFAGGEDLDDITVFPAAQFLSVLGIDSTSLTGGGTYTFPGTSGFEADGVEAGTPATSGTMELRFGGQTTAALTFTDGGNQQVLTSPTAAQVQSALEGLSTIGAGNVTVTAIGGNVASAPNGSSRGCFLVDFTGTLAGTPLSQLEVYFLTGGSGNSFGVYTMRNGVAGTNEVQTVTLSGTPGAGTFTLSYGSETTGPIAYNASATDVDTALEALTGIPAGGVTCTGGALPGTLVTITFGGSLAYTNVAEFIINDNGLKVIVTETTPGVTATNEVQSVSLTGSPHGGTATLTYDGQTTGAIAYNADNSTIQTALIALSNLAPGDVVVTGGPWPAAVIVTFGGTLAATNVVAITGSGTGLNNGIVTHSSLDPIIFTVTTANSGPSDILVLANWSDETLPVAGDTVVADQGSSPMKYHLDQLATGLARFDHYARYTGQIGLPEINNEFGEPYYEFRPQYLVVDAPTINIGLGTGNGSGRIKIKGVVGTAVTVNCYKTDTELDPGIESLLLVLPNTSSIVNVNRGRVGIAIYPGETSTVATLKVGFTTNQDGDSLVRCGSGVTLTTVEVLGGVATLQSAVTTLTQTGGQVFQLAGGITTANIGSGALRYLSAATLVTCTLGTNAILDFREDIQARTVTNFAMNAGSELHDPHGTATFTNGIDLVQCTPDEVTLNIKPHQTITLSAV